MAKPDVDPIIRAARDAALANLKVAQTAINDGNVSEAKKRLKAASRQIKALVVCKEIENS